MEIRLGGDIFTTNSKTGAIRLIGPGLICPNHLFLRQYLHPAKSALGCCFMKIVRYFFVALESLMAYKLRAFLTLLGFIIGVAAVTSMFGLGRGLSDDIITQMNAGGGTDLLEVYPFNTFTNADLTALTNTAFNPALATVLPLYPMETELIANGQKQSNPVLGTTTDYLTVKDVSLKAGRFITPADEARQEAVAVIGDTAAGMLFSGQNPLGQTIIINQEILLVVGVMEAKGGFDYFGPDSQIIVPLSLAQNRLFNAPRENGSRQISFFTIRAVDVSQLEAAKSQIEVTLRLQHGLTADDANDFNIQAQADMLEMVQNVSNTLTIFLGGIGAISLLVAGIGIMNIMLVSVTERTREIGLRKALGAHDADILLQFLIEALVFCLLGGALGLGLTCAVREIVKPFSTPEFPLKILVQADAVLLAVGISLFCGVVFGLYPAIRASNLSPIEALHYE